MYNWLVLNREDCFIFMYIYCCLLCSIFYMYFMMTIITNTYKPSLAGNKRWPSLGLVLTEAGVAADILIHYSASTVPAKLPTNPHTFLPVLCSCFADVWIRISLLFLTVFGWRVGSWFLSLSLSWFVAYGYHAPYTYV